MKKRQTVLLAWILLPAFAAAGCGSKPRRRRRREKRSAGLAFELAGVPGLQYDAGYGIVQGEGLLMIVDRSDRVVGSFDSGTAFYREIAGRLPD